MSLTTVLIHSLFIASPLALEVVDLGAVAVEAVVVGEHGVGELVGPDLGRVLPAAHVETFATFMAYLMRKLDQFAG